MLESPQVRPQVSGAAEANVLQETRAETTDQPDCLQYVPPETAACVGNAAVGGAAELQPARSTCDVPLPVAVAEVAHRQLTPQRPPAKSSPRRKPAVGLVERSEQPMTPAAAAAITRVVATFTRNIVSYDDLLRIAYGDRLPTAPEVGLFREAVRADSRLVRTGKRGRRRITPEARVAARLPQNAPAAGPGQPSFGAKLTNLRAAGGANNAALIKRQNRHL